MDANVKAAKLEAVVRYRAQGHTQQWIADDLDVPRETVRNWLQSPDVLARVATVAREAMPDAETAARTAGAYLMSVIGGEEADAQPGDKIRAASVIMANHQRMIEVTAKSREADAATSQAKTADELRALEAEAQAYLAEVAKRQK